MAIARTIIGKLRLLCADCDALTDRYGSLNNQTRRTRSGVANQEKRGPLRLERMAPISQLLRMGRTRIYVLDHAAAVRKRSKVGS